MAKKKSRMPTSRAKNAYELLDEVRALILAEPKRYDQAEWVRDYGQNLPRCGTVACVGGWVQTLKGVDVGGVGGLLGLTVLQEDELFNANAATGSRQTIRHARSGAAHIRRFQKEYAEQLKAKAV